MSDAANRLNIIKIKSEDVVNLSPNFGAHSEEADNVNRQSIKT